MKKIIFIMIVLITVCSKAYGYTDVKSDYWAYKVINALSDAEILSGYPEGDFRPEEKMTKAEFMTLLSKTLGLNIDVSSVSSHWADGYINALRKENVIEFLEYSAFNPDGDITRWEICKMIVNSFESTKNSVVNVKSPVFSDIDVFNVEEQRVAKILKDTGVLAGYPDGTVGFYNTSTRAEVSSFIYNLINRLDNVKYYGENIIYENNIAVSRIDDDRIKLRKYEFAEDNEYCTTLISSIKMFEFDKAGETEYKKIFEQIYNGEHPYFIYRNKFGKGKYVLAIEFDTKNETLDYDIPTGYQFLHVSFDGEDEINIIDAFDIDEIENQINNNAYGGKFVKPGESLDTSAFYILDKLPSERFYINRSITTLYDSKNMKNINAKSFHSAVIYL